MKKRKRSFSFFFLYYCCDHKKKDNLVNAYCKHQQIKEEVFLFNNQNVHLDSFVDRESRSALMELHTWNGLDLGFM